MESECVACRSNSSGRPRNLLGFLFAHKRITSVPYVLIYVVLFTSSGNLAIQFPYIQLASSHQRISCDVKMSIWTIFNWKACRHTFQPITMLDEVKKEIRDPISADVSTYSGREREWARQLLITATNKSTDYHVSTTEIENCLLLYISFVYLIFFSIENIRCGGSPKECFWNL